MNITTNLLMKRWINSSLSLKPYQSSSPLSITSLNSSIRYKTTTNTNNITLNIKSIRSSLLPSLIINNSNNINNNIINFNDKRFYCSTTNNKKNEVEQLQQEKGDENNKDEKEELNKNDQEQEENTDKEHHRHHRSKRETQNPFPDPIIFKSLSNLTLMAVSLGFTISSLVSYVFYIMENTEQRKENYLVTIANYFWWCPPYKVWEKNGEFNSLLENLRNNTLSPTEKQLLCLLAISDVGADFLLRNNVYEILYERFKDLKNQGVEPKHIPPGYYSILLQLAIQGKKHIADDDAQNRFFESMAPLFKIQSGDVIASMIGAAAMSFLAFRKRPAILGKAVVNSVLATGLFLSAPIYYRKLQDSFVGDSNSLSTYATKLQVFTIGYNFTLFFVSCLPYISWIIPIATIVPIKKSIEMLSLVSSFQKEMQTQHRLDEEQGIKRPPPTETIFGGIGNDGKDSKK